MCFWREREYVCGEGVCVWGMIEGASVGEGVCVEEEKECVGER